MRLRMAGAAAALGVGAAIATAAPAWAEDAGPATSASSTGRAVAAGPAKSAARPAAVAARRAARPAARTAHTTSAVSPKLTVTGSGQSPFVLSGGSSAASELSGITFAGGDIMDTTYYAVGDSTAGAIWQVYTSLNGATGRIRSSLVSGAINAPQLGRDSEGIALTPTKTSVWVSDEIASSITEFSLDGQKVGTVAVPSIYRPSNVQSNRGLESLSYGAGRLWTANEEALKPDGALSTTTAGSWVRVQEFTGDDFAAGRQFGYLTDPISRLSPFVTVERSGLVDLVALPDGQVLALERELGGLLPRFRSRIYLIGFAGATDVSALPSLTGGGFTPVTKTLLWQGYFGFSNFEGMALGPKTADGTYSLLLIADDGAGELAQRQDVLSLVLSGVGDPVGPPAPPSTLV